MARYYNRPSGGVYSPPGQSHLQGRGPMELYDVMRTTFSAREFTADPLPDEASHDSGSRRAFAPRRRQPPGPGALIVVPDRRTREGGRRDRSRGEGVRRAGAGGREPRGTPSTHEGGRGYHRANPRRPAHRAGLLKAPSCSYLRDLKVVASMDSELERAGVISGGPSIRSREHPARRAPRGVGRDHHHAGRRPEPILQKLLACPLTWRSRGDAAGRPVKAITKLTRKPVASSR